MKQNNTMRKIVFWAAVGALATCATANAALSSLSFDLTESSDYGAGNYGRVDIVADDAAGTVDFTVTAFDVQPLYGNLYRFGLDAFLFNFDSAAISEWAWQWDTELPYRWYQYSAGAYSYDFGGFDVNEYTNSSYQRHSTLNFSIELSDASEAVASNFAEANDNGYLFLAHIGGFYGNTEGGGGSGHWVAATTPVPTPGASLLGLVGLAVLSRFRRSDLIG